MMFDLQVSSDATYGKHSILSGTRNDLVVTFPTVADTDFTTGGAKWSGLRLPVLQVNSGYRISGNAVIASAATCSQTFAINLISLIGSLGSSKYFPLFACTSAPLRVEITLASTALATAACAYYNDYYKL